MPAPDSTGPSTGTSATGSSNLPRLPRRPYGRHGIELSIIGMGGIVVMDAPQDHANHVVAQAVERGVNYFDVAPTYGDAEVKLGPALQPYRKNCFLACKTIKREAAVARPIFAKSLENLRTDYFDLYQLHAMTDVAKDVDTAFAKGGVMEMVVAEKKAGRIRHVGFSAHSVEAALAAMDRYEFDSILFPINFTTWFSGFGAPAVAEARKRGMSILALKALARQVWPENDPQKKVLKHCWYEPVTDRAEAELALRFTLSQPVTAALPPGEESLFQLAVDLALNFRPLTAAEEQTLRDKARLLMPIFPET